MKKLMIPALLLALTVSLSACGASEATASAAETAAAAASSATSAAVSAADETEPASAVEPEQAAAPTAAEDLPEGFSVATETASGYTYSAGVLTITGEGTYILSGTLDGQVIVAAGEDSKVKLVLSGADISCSTGAPIYVAGAKKVTLIAAEQTENTIADNRSRREAAPEEITPENAGGAVFSDCDLKLEGTGSLTITGEYNNGIHCKDDLTIKELTLSVNAVKHAVKGNDSITVESGCLSLIARQGDGLKSSASDISAKGNQRGNVTVSGGTVEIWSACDGIDAAYNAEVSGDAVLTILTDSYSEYSEEIVKEEEEEDEVQTTATTGWGRPGGPGGFPGGFDQGGGAAASLDYSCKGIKADNAVLISGGTISISSTDDAIHTNSDELLETGEYGAGSVTIDGGSISIITGDDGIHADTDLTLNGGSVEVTESYEGLEGCVITINGGEHRVYASDDGLNAATSDYSNTPVVVVNGGSLRVTTPTGDTDAIDSNGSYSQTGGTVLVFGGASMGAVAGSIDVDGEIQVTGGMVVALGGICEVPKESCNAYVMSGTNFAAGEYVLAAADGNELLRFTADTACSNGWLCSDQLVTGTSYVLTCDGETVAEWTQEEGNQGAGLAMFSGGFPFGGGFPGGGPGGRRG